MTNRPHPLTGLSRALAGGVLGIALFAAHASAQTTTFVDLTEGRTSPAPSAAPETGGVQAHYVDLTGGGETQPQPSRTVSSPQIHYIDLTAPPAVVALADAQPLGPASVPTSVSTGGPALQPVAIAQTDDDPLEGVNRFFLESNLAMDDLVLKPLAEVYLSFPDFVQEGVHNFLTNFDGPKIFVNDVLQGEPRRAGETAARFMVNSTVGVAGFIDVGARLGIPEHSEDFGQTLAVYGVGDAPYMVAPVIGPTNPRDLAGFVADIFLNPLRYAWDANWKIYWEIGRRGVKLVDARARNFDTVETLKSSSLDLYVAVRNLYAQQRASEISNGEIDVQDLPDF